MVRSGHSWRFQAEHEVMCYIIGRLRGDAGRWCLLHLDPSTDLQHNEFMMDQGNLLELIEWHIPDVIAILDTDGIIRYMSPSH